MAAKKQIPRRHLAPAIIGTVLIVAIGAGHSLSKARRTPPGLQVATTTESGTQPPHVRGQPGAPITLGESGDFECVPCFILWLAMRDLEKVFGDRAAMSFRQNPMPQHRKARWRPRGGGGTSRVAVLGH